MKRILSLISLICICTAAFAASTVTVQAPGVVSVDEQFNVTFVVSGENSPSAFQWEPSEDFQLVWGPQKGTSTSVSIVNGHTTRSAQTTYTYVLMPKRVGTFTLPPATATVRSESFSSRSITVEVVGGGSSQNVQSQEDRSRQSGNVDRSDLYMRLILSSSRVVVGEPVSATLKLYRRVNIAGFEDVKFPTFSGFWSQETQSPSNIEFRRENVGGEVFETAVLRAWTLIPQRSGDLQIDPAELVCLVNIRSPRASTGSILDSFFQDEYETIRKRLSTSAQTVHVAALPAGAPASFCGGVGSFKMSAELTRDSLRTHDAASLKVSISGKGNLALLEAPKLEFPLDFEVYDVKTTESNGVKTFEFPFIPRSAGDFVIGPVEYSFYDITAKRYVTLSSKPLPIKVMKGAEGAAPSLDQYSPSNVQKDVRNLGSDIRYISTKTSPLKGSDSLFFGSLGFCAASLLLIVSAIILFFALKGFSRRKADVEGSRKRGASKVARRRLSQAGAYLEKNLYTAFYEELHKALDGYAADKLSMDASDMSKDNIKSEFLSRGVDESLCDEFVSLLDACEFARYSPQSDNEGMRNHYESALSTVSSIDENMRPVKKARGSAAAVLVLLMLLPAGLRAAEYPDSLWTAGVVSYESGDWAAAASNWTAVEALGLHSPELYFNLGNAFFKQGETGRAILYYERALKLKPSYPAAKFNLDFARSTTIDRIEAVPEFFLKTWSRTVCKSLSSNSWAVIFLISLAAFLSCGLIFLLGRRRSVRKSAFFTGIVILLLCLCSLGFGLGARADMLKADRAVVTRSVSGVKSSPSGGTDLFILHEGTELKILDSVGEWLNVELADGRQGWMNSADLELI